MPNAENGLSEAPAGSAMRPEEAGSGSGAAPCAPEDAASSAFGRELEAARAAFADMRVSLPLPDSCEIELLMKRMDDGGVAVGIKASDLMELVWDAEPKLLAAGVCDPEDGEAPGAAAALDAFADDLESGPAPGLPNGLRAFCARAVRRAAMAAAECRAEAEEDACPRP